MTVESCQAFCSQQNPYGLAGLEYADECWCANALSDGSVLGQSGCSMPCSGNSAEICGGPNRLSVYNLTTYTPPSIPAAVAGYAYQGCYQEVPGRLLPGPNYSNTTANTVEMCVGFCQGKGYAVAGLEYARQCFCGNVLPTSAVSVPSAQCNMLCTGNAKEYCGAGNLLNVYVAAG